MDHVLTPLGGWVQRRMTAGLILKTIPSEFGRDGLAAIGLGRDRAKRVATHDCASSAVKLWGNWGDWVKHRATQSSECVESCRLDTNLRPIPASTYQARPGGRVWQARHQPPITLSIDQQYLPG